MAFLVGLQNFTDVVTHHIKTFIYGFEAVFKLFIILAKVEDILLVLVNPVLLLFSHVLHKSLIIFDEFDPLWCFGLTVDFLENLQVKKSKSVTLLYSSFDSDWSISLASS